MGAAELDPLAALREQLERTEDAARALGRAATAARGAGERDAPRFGWQRPGADSTSTPDDGELAAALGALVDAVRLAIPPELAERLAAVAREVLLAIRAVIDVALERTEARRRAPATVEDIPIL